MWVGGKGCCHAETVYERHEFEVRHLNEPEKFIITGLPNSGLLQNNKKA
jgi:hypothetical protein